MVTNNTSRHCTAFTVSIEAKDKVTTGISAFDRAQTIKTVLDPNTKPSDLVQPGHIFPIRVKDGGVLVRAGHSEAVVDLAKLAGLYPAGVICEIMDDDGINNTPISHGSKFTPLCRQLSLSYFLYQLFMAKTVSNQISNRYYLQAKFTSHSLSLIHI